MNVQPVVGARAYVAGSFYVMAAEGRWVRQVAQPKEPQGERAPRRNGRRGKR